MMRVVKNAASAVLLVLVLAGSSPAQLGDLREALDFARGKVYPALVNISVVSEDYVGGRIRRFPSAGSGVIVSPAGHVVTNFHVAGESARVNCTLPTGEVLDARIVAEDPYTDLCVLKLVLDTRDDPTIPIPFATLGESEDLEVGDHVLAMGNPLTLSSSMTLGIISNKKRVFTDFTGTQIEEFTFEEGQSTGIYNQWIQHDALILPGNSGGPLVNLRGEVVGINTRGGGGVGFAIPAYTVKQVLNQALTFGEIRRGWLGFTVLPAGKAGLKHGAFVAGVIPESPAAEAGLKPGDIITRLGNAITDVVFFDQVPLLYQRIAEMAVGSTVACTFIRANKEQTCQMAVAPLEKFLGEEREFRTLGFTVRDVTRPMAIARNFPDENGVLVTGVRPGQPFEESKPPIPGGAVIIEMAGKKITDLQSFADILKEAPEKFPVTYRTEDEVMVTLVDTKKSDDARVGKELPKAWLGVQTQVLTEQVAEALGIPGQKGFRVTRVYPWTKAQEAGLKVGDVLVAMDGDPLDAFRPQDAEDLRRAIEDMSIGDEVEFTVLRGGESVTVTVDLQESPASALDVKSVTQEELEFRAREVTFMDRVRWKWPHEAAGLLVTEVTSGGWADIAGLRINDLMVTINEQPVPDIKSFEQVMGKVLAERPELVQIFVRRGNRTHFVFIEPDWVRLDASRHR